jgi:hypothetical protein
MPASAYNLHLERDYYVLRVSPDCIDLK